MAQVPANDYINVGGKVEVLLAFPFAVFAAPNWPFSPVRSGTPTAPTTNAEAYIYLFKLGELEDMVQVTQNPMLHQVYGDRHGGRNGDPIEQQDLGFSSRFELTLSRFDREVSKLMQTIGGLRNTTGKIPLNTVGGLLHRDRSFRCLLYTVRDPAMSRNFPCCLVENQRSITLGSKYSTMSLNIGAHRAPEGHWGVQVSGSSINGATDFVTGYVENVDTTGVADPYVPT